MTHPHHRHIPFPLDTITGTLPLGVNRVRAVRPGGPGALVSGNLEKMKPPPPDRRPRRTEERTDWFLIAVPVVIFWLLLLFAPASSPLALGERIVVGTVATAVIVPMMWFRSRH